MDVEISAANTAGLDLDLFNRPMRINNAVLQGLIAEQHVPGHHCHAAWGGEPRRCQRPQASRIYGKETLVSAMATRWSYDRLDLIPAGIVSWQESIVNGRERFTALRVQEKFPEIAWTVEAFSSLVDVITNKYQGLKVQWIVQDNINRREPGIVLT